jgi:hypothetical protein
MHPEANISSPWLDSHRLLERAMKLQLSEDGGNLAEVESCLQQALDLSPDNIEALEETAHFYHAVMPDSQKAAHCANRCREKAAALVAEMDGILADLS